MLKKNGLQVPTQSRPSPVVGAANQKKAKRARWLIHQGLYQKANQTIQSTVSLVADDTSAPALASKFPPFDTDYPIPTKPDCNRDQINSQFDDEVILDVLAHLPRLSGVDQFGHSYELYSNLARSGYTKGIICSRLGEKYRINRPKTSFG